MIAETYWDLLSDVNHWLFEFSVEGVVALFLWIVAWPSIKKHIIRNHDKTYHGGEH